MLKHDVIFKGIARVEAIYNHFDFCHDVLRTVQSFVGSNDDLDGLVNRMDKVVEDLLTGASLSTNINVTLEIDHYKVDCVITMGPSRIAVRNIKTGASASVVSIMGRNNDGAWCCRETFRNDLKGILGD